MRAPRIRFALVLGLIASVGCASDPHPAADLAAAVESRIAEVEAAGGTVRLAAFVVTDGVFNSELMAPYDVLHHTVFRDSLDYVEPVVVSPDGGPVTTFEGLRVDAHYSFATAPQADILVIPSTDGSLDRDLDDDAYMSYVTRAAEAAEWVLTVCDGAFPLAATGLLDGRVATTFPADRAAMAERFPEVDVRDDVRLVVDGTYITSVGGGMSYEPAFWLVEHLWGPERVEGNAEGLVWPWDLTTLPHLVVERDPGADR
ncbi:MAG: glutamine amidotransferase [Rhodothermaceae bacterium]|nr:glutamine amidotransferase [Rhodothermaceae bacterium]